MNANNKNTLDNVEIHLSDEQQKFIGLALEGKNILVEACIGSGKTTSIQALCNTLPSKKKILYLTYNRLLKVDAKNKITNRNATVTNYHGFVYPYLLRAGYHCGFSDSITKFTEKRLPIPKFDVLIIDEYQDIELDFSKMLEYIKSTNPAMQIIMVGDMAQKIYDKTTLNVHDWALDFIGDHVDYEFTKCFRLQPELASELGDIWNKRIEGVNPDCTVRTMKLNEIAKYLAEQNPGDILCLGAKTGVMTDVLNKLETRYHEKFNKFTVYATINDRDANIEPNPNTAIFTTFDGSKGMEKPICVIFDWDTSYWYTRAGMPDTKQSILKNIFCVAASRGKKEIIFVQGKHSLLTREDICSPFPQTELEEVYTSNMFDFKYVEDIQTLMKMLKTKPIPSNDTSVIKISNKDGLIDLSPCIGIYEEAVFFTKYDIDADIKLTCDMHSLKNIFTGDYSLDKKILYLTKLETCQNRYVSQVNMPFVSDDEKKQLIDRLSTEFSPDETVQVDTDYDLNGVKVKSRCDVLKDNIVWELKFTSELRPEHYLQLAMYLITMDKPYGILWNVRTNKKVRVSIKGSKKKFLKQVYKTITKTA